MLTVVRVRWFRNIPLLNWSKSNLNFNATIFSHNYHLNTLFYCWIYILHLYAYLWNESGHIFARFSFQIELLIFFVSLYFISQIVLRTTNLKIPCHKVSEISLNFLMNICWMLFIVIEKTFSTPFENIPNIITMESRVLWIFYFIISYGASKMPYIYILMFISRFWNFILHIQNFVNTLL